MANWISAKFGEWLVWVKEDNRKGSSVFPRLTLTITFNSEEQRERFKREYLSDFGFVGEGKDITFEDIKPYFEKRQPEETAER